MEMDKTSNSSGTELVSNVGKAQDVTTEHDPPSVGNQESSGSSTENAPDFYMLDQTRNCFVTIKRLSKEMLNKYTRKPEPTESMSTSTNDSESVNETPGMVLREHIQTPRSRTLCPTVKHVDYTNMDADSDMEVPLNHQPVKSHPLSGPSKSRIWAQHIITKQDVKLITSSSNNDEPENSQSAASANDEKSW